jgi:hypothetical protein
MGINGNKFYYLIYVSQAVKPMSDEDHLKLVEQSYFNNKELEITGLLLYQSKGEADAHIGRYMQLLEGRESEIKLLFQKISSDSRHNRVTLINEGYLKRKHFKDWTMAFKRVNDKVLTHPGFIELDNVFDQKLSSSKFSIALTFLRTFYGLQNN